MLAFIGLSILTVLSEWISAPTQDPLSNIISIIDKFGVVGLLILSVAAFMREDVVPGRRYRIMEKDRDEWRARALNAMRGWEELASATEVAVVPPEGTRK
jgi:hypothetical protein